VSLYDVLGVGKDADQASIKRAHRKAAKLMTERKAIMAVEKNKTEAKIKRVKKLLKRIKFDNDGTDIIGNVYKERIEKLELEVLEFEKVVARLGAAVEYLKHYGFEFTEQEQPTIRTFTWVKMS
jgi:hypothetical protein